MEYVLKTNHLTKTIGGKDIVSDIELHVKKGEIYGFLGPNMAMMQSWSFPVTEWRHW